MSTEADLAGEIRRIRRVADMLCSGHAVLRDAYARKALALELSILGLSTWLAALAFVAPRLNLSLTPFRVDPQLWGGVLSVLTLFLAIAQLKTDWKGRSDAHRRSVAIYAEVKREAGYLLACGELEERACRRIFAQYDLASAVSIEIPERFFLREKQRHKLKVAVSRYIDSHPAASILLVRLRLRIRDNFGSTEPHA